MWLEELLSSPIAISVILTVLIHVLAFVFGYGKLRNRVETIEDDLKKYKDKTDQLVKDTSEMHGSFNTFKETQLVTRSSPITLTKAGHGLLKESGGEQFLEKNFDNLLGHFKGINNAYDIQEMAKKVIKDMENKEGFNEIKDYLYQHGREFDDIALVMGILLRDMVLSKRNIPAKQVDTDAPTQKMSN